MARWVVSSVNEHGQPVGAPLNVALPRPYPRHEKRVGHWGFVEPVRADHAAALFAAFKDDPAGYTYLPEAPYASEAELAAHLAKAAQSTDPQWYAVCDPVGRALGHATYLRITPDVGVAEVGWIHFAPELQRTPLATEAMYLMMAHIFDDLGYRRYEWKCDALNAPSRAAAARLGFTYEGTFRQATAYKGRNRDTAWFSILDSEWPDRRKAFQDWLDPSNFDENGQQLSSLAMPTR